MSENKFLRGHHIGVLAVGLARSGNISKYYENLFEGSQVILTASDQDNICLKCTDKKEDCSERYALLDYRVAESFGLIIGREYDFDKDIIPCVSGFGLSEKTRYLVTYWDDILTGTKQF
jgi:hypothetical protein